jgi:CheY-like chemotaxis protein
MLGVIIGRADIALKGLASSDERHAHLLEILDAAKRSAELTRQLLAYARRQAVAPCVIDPNEAITASLRMLRLIVGEGVALKWVPGVDIWPVKVDPGQLDQILTNLCANARDAITDVGEVTIRTENVTLREPAFASRIGVDVGDYAVIEVDDDGAGIDLGLMPHIFDPFFTTKPPGHGSGLGLSVVYGIARQNEGGVLVESTVGRGSVFKVFLPRYAGDTGLTRARTHRAPAPGGSETLLLVEDEPALLSMGSAMLEGLGYTVLTARSAAEALRIASSHEGDIALLITDLVMPGMNGRDLAEKLVANRPGLQHLFISGYPDEVISVHRAVEAGMHFLAKPFSLDDLAATVRAALHRDA